jgi:hypothetical protein
MTPLLFFLSGLAVFLYGLRLIRESREMGRWPVVAGTIVSAEAKRTVRAAGTEDQRFIPELAYEFTYNGKSHRGDRYTLVPVDSRGTAGVNAILQRYPAGQSVPVHVNPQDPTRSVLSISTDANQWAYALGGLCLIGVGIYLFFSTR